MQSELFSLAFHCIAFKGWKGGDKKGLSKLTIPIKLMFGKPKNI